MQALPHVYMTFRNMPCRSAIVWSCKSLHAEAHRHAHLHMPAQATILLLRVSFPCRLVVCPHFNPPRLSCSVSMSYIEMYALCSIVCPLFVSDSKCNQRCHCLLCSVLLLLRHGVEPGRSHCRARLSSLDLVYSWDTPLGSVACFSQKDAS